MIPRNSSCSFFTSYGLETESLWTNVTTLKRQDYYIKKTVPITSRNYPFNYLQIINQTQIYLLYPFLRILGHPPTERCYEPNIWNSITLNVKTAEKLKNFQRLHQKLEWYYKQLQGQSELTCLSLVLEFFLVCPSTFNTKHT